MKINKKDPSCNLFSWIIIFTSNENLAVRIRVINEKGLVYAGVAQSVAQLICNQSVAGSSPVAGSNGENSFREQTYELPFLTLPQIKKE